MPFVTDHLSARAALDLLVYSPLDWPGKTVRLDPDSAQSHLQRAVSGVPSVAELYHANSRLGSATAGRLLAARTDVAGVRRLAVQRSAAASSRRNEGAPAPPPELTGLLLATRDAAGTDLFFALEVRFVHADVLYVFEPLTGRCSVAGVLTATDRQAVARGLRVLAPRPAESGAPSAGEGDPSALAALVVVVGRLGRHDVLYGPRGYRRTLIEAGRLSQELVRLATGAGFNPVVVTEFGDEELDAAALVDGVAEGCVAVIELRRARDDG